MSISFQIVVEVTRANGDVGVVAIDDFNHNDNDDKCDTLPVEAKPIQTTLKPTTTTPEPTEPPGRTLCHFLIEFHLTFLIF